MKIVLRILLGAVIVAAVVGLPAYLYQQSQADPEVYETTSPFKADIVKKTVATGSIVPKKEVLVKPVVSGIIGELYVQPGDTVENGQLLAKIRVIPNMGELARANNQVEQAKIDLGNAKARAENSEAIYERQKSLFDKGVIAEQDFQQFETDFRIAEGALESARETLRLAEDNLQIVKEGALARDQGSATTLVKSTVEGMVLDVPIEVGGFVIESNTFNEGTTVAVVADMAEMIFEGKVDESEVGKLKEGMPLLLSVAALDGVTFEASLDYISPKGVDDQGTIKFEVKAAVELQEGYFLRSGYSANADIVLDERKDVLAIGEGDLTFKKDTAYAEVMVGEQRFEKRVVETGLSDGINVEILSGLEQGDKVKKRK